MRTVLVVAALAVAAIAWWWSLPGAAPPPSHTTAASHSAAAAGALVPALGAAPDELPARSEVAALRTAVIGTALDAGGAPLAGFGVSLQRVDERPLNTMRLEAYFEAKHTPQSVAVATVDSAGAFAFASLDAGEYRCSIVGVDDGAERFTLATGEVHELALVSPLTALTGTLFRAGAGAVVADCFVRLDDGKTRRALPMPDQRDGTIRAFAAAGQYDVLVYKAGRHDGQGFGPCLSRHVLLVPPGVPALRWQFEAGGTEIAIAVADTDGVAVDTFTAVIEGIGACDGATGRYVLPNLPGRGATLAALPAGEWRVSLQGSDLVAEPRALTTGPADPRQVISFTVVRAAIVRVRLRARSTFSAAASMRVPPLRAGNKEIPGGDRRDDAAGGDHVYEYHTVPAGRVELSLQDTVTADEIVPLPFDPVAPIAFDAAAGQTKQLDVDVVPRAIATLSACDDGGRMLPGATIEVWAAERRVRHAVDAPSPRWIGWLPPGDYRIVIDRQGVRREHTLHVDRADVQERFRP